MSCGASVLAAPPSDPPLDSAGAPPGEQNRSGQSKDPLIAAVERLFGRGPYEERQGPASPTQNPAILSGVGDVIVGIICLAYASAHKPTLEHLLTQGDGVISGGTYGFLIAFGWVSVVWGILGVALELTQQRDVVTVRQQSLPGSAATTCDALVAVLPELGHRLVLANRPSGIIVAQSKFSWWTTAKHQLTVSSHDAENTTNLSVKAETLWVLENPFYFGVAKQRSALIDGLLDRLGRRLGAT